MSAYRVRVLGLAAVLATMTLLASGSAWAFTCSLTGNYFDNEGASDGGDFFNSTACGNTATATGPNSTAVGGQSYAGSQASAFGEFARATGANSSAFGQASYASMTQASAFGQYARATGANSSAFGQSSWADGTGASAFGQGAVASAENSAAFGNGAQATIANQQVFGTASNTYTMRGIASAASTAAQSGPVGFVTSDAGGNLAVDTDAFNQIDRNQQGVAMALALSNFWVPTGKQFAAGLNVGTWDGSWAVGGNIGGQVGDGAYLTGGIAVSQNGMVAGRAGGVLAW